MIRTSLADAVFSESGGDPHFHSRCKMAKQHVIIGGGPVATNAIETIRQFDKGESSITLICDEPAHSRMALPYWLSGQVPREHTYTADDAYWQKLGVTAKIGVRATDIDAAAKSVAVDDGSSVPYDDLLIATGSSPLPLNIPGADLPGVQPLWTLDQTDRLLQFAQGESQPRVVMIGAGFIGFIMLNAMHKRGWKLSVVEREPHVLPRMLDAGAAVLVHDWFGEKQINLQCGVAVQGITEADDGSKRVQLADGRELEADAVIIATGVQPNVDLAQDAGVAVNHGIVVDDHLRTSAADIYSGGDCAEGPVMYGNPAVHAIQPTAVDHGRVAGANMAGQDVAYPGSLLMNVLDCCGLQCASFGAWDEAGAERMTISSPGSRVYRQLLWTGDRITGAIFVGQANDLGMLTDVGMVKGILQTQSPLGEWKGFLKENPFDIRRPYVATKVAQKLTSTTLLGRPAEPRQFRFGGANATTPVTPHHTAFVSTK